MHLQTVNNHQVSLVRSLGKIGTNTKKIKYNELKCNIEKPFFGKTKMEYLSFWVTHNGIQPINNKSESIVNIIPPNNTKQAREFIGLVIYYRVMWSRWSYLLHPLTASTSNKMEL